MKKIYLLLFFVSILAISANAQVTIGSEDAPTPGAVLELKSTNLGFLPSRVDLVNPSNPAPLATHVQGMVVFNKTVNDSLSVGLYFNTGNRWVNMSTGSFTAKNWFYMPSIAIDTSIGTGRTVNLYNEYKKQLNDDVDVISSTGAPAKALSSIPAAKDLFYYVTAYDDSVFDNITIDVNGVMTYDIIGPADEATFLNIVFVEK